MAKWLVPKITTSQRNGIILDESEIVYDTDTGTLYTGDGSTTGGTQVAGGGGGSDTAAQVKTKYESNADTNAFTDAEQSKLAGIEAGATADQTQGDINALDVTALELQDLKKHGVVSGLVLSINGGDTNTYDISAGTYYIDGVRYTFGGVTAQPSIGLAGDFITVGLTSGGINEKLNGFYTYTESETIIELGAYVKESDNVINYIGGSSLDFPNMLEEVHDRIKYFDGAKFLNSSAKITESVTPLQLNIASGQVSTAGLSVKVIGTEIDLGANPIYNIAGVEKIRAKVTPYVVSTSQYDNGTDLVSIPTDKFVTHSVLRSTRTDNIYVVTGKTVYDSLGEASIAEPDLSVFGNVAGSEVEPLALLVVQEGATSITSVIDIRNSRTDTSIASLVDTDVPNPQPGQRLTFNGIKWVAETPTVVAGQSVNYFLGSTPKDGNNFSLDVSPVGGAEETVTVAANNTTAVFMERYMSDPIGGTQIDGGSWVFNTYASVNADQGVSEVKIRLNKSVTKVGTITSTGTGTQRTFTATEAGTFIAGDANADILEATFIQTPTETFYIDGFVSDTVVTASSTNAGYVNESAVAFNLDYKLFEVTTGEINGSAPLLYTSQTVQPSFAVDPSDSILISYFAVVDTGASKSITVYKNGAQNYSNLSTPLVIRHNSLAGLNAGDYKHLTSTEYTKLTNIEANANNYVHPVTHEISEVSGLQTALNGKVDDAQVQTNVPAGALFTDTTYSVGDGGLTEINFTSADNTKLDGIATGAQVNDPNTTTQGNTFNGVSQLVQTDGTGKLPAIDGSQLTNLPAGASDLNGLTDVVITTPATDEVLKYDGANWVNGTAAGGAGLLVDTGFENIFNTEGSMSALTTGFNNTVIGTNNANAMTSGSNNVIYGTGNMSALTAGTSNVAIGINCLDAGTDNNKVSTNVAIGSNAAKSGLTITNCVAIGNQALGTIGGDSVVAIGRLAGKGSFSNVVPSNSVFVGSYAGQGVYDGIANTCVGDHAGFTVGGSDYNTFIGDDAGYYHASGGGLCTAIGTNAMKKDQAAANDGIGSNKTCIGYDSRASGDNQVQLGNSATTTYVYGTVQDRSDLRDKADVRDTIHGLDFIKSLRPVDYRWDFRIDYEETTTEIVDGVEVETTVQLPRDGSKKRNRYHHGFIAQEVEEVIGETGKDFGGYQDHSLNGGNEIKSIGYNEFIAPLVKAVQELSAKVEAQQAEIDALKGV